MISLFHTIKETLSPIYRLGDDFHPSSVSNQRHSVKEPPPLMTSINATTLSLSPLEKKKKWQRKYDSSQSTTRIVSQPVKSKNYYHDPCHISNPDTSIMIEELLPPYTCSLKKTGQMYIKREMDHHYQPSVDRRWKRYHVHLHGTLLDVFTCMSVREKRKRRKPTILLQQGLQGAKVGWASDYVQKPYILRLYSTITGEQLLLRPIIDDKTEHQEENGLRAMVEWIEQIQAAINISMDIDEQKMPTFVTLARTHYRHHTNMATVILDQSKLAVQTCPDRGTQTTSITITNNNTNNNNNNNNNNSSSSTNNNNKLKTKWRRGFKKMVIIFYS